MTRALLDAHALIALADGGHVHHDRARAWYADASQIATCPTVEGSLVRYLVRIGDSVRAARAILERLHADDRHDFWPDDLSYAEADLGRVVGHRQVTDASLASLAAQRGGRLATFDEGLALARADVVDLIP